MKRSLCLISALLAVVLMLSACNFQTQFTNTMQNSAQSTEKVKAMLNAMAEGDIDAAVELMHPDAASDSRAGIVQMQEYLNGRTLSVLSIYSINVNSSAGTSGKMRQETVVFQALLSDETVIPVSVVYLSDGRGEGFVGFRLLLGVL